MAHYGIVGDLHKVIPLLIKAYRTKGAAAVPGAAKQVRRRRCADAGAADAAEGGA